MKRLATKKQLEDFARHKSACHTLLNAFMDEYEKCYLEGRLVQWAAALKATADLLECKP